MSLGFALLFAFIGGLILNLMPCVLPIISIKIMGFVDAGRLKGYGVLRKCRVGYKIGPLFADQPEIAEALFAALCNHAVGDLRPPPAG